MCQRQTGRSIDHDKMTEVNHTLFVQNSQVNIRTARCVIWMRQRLMLFISNSGEHVIVIEVTRETFVSVETQEVVDGGGMWDTPGVWVLEGME